MTTSNTREPLQLSQSPKRQLSSVGIFAIILCAYILLASLGIIPDWLMWFGVIVFGVVILVGLYAALKARDAAWELRLDENGVTVRGYPTTPWTDLSEIRLTGPRPRWLFPLLQRQRVVAFVGQPGVDVPTLPSSRGHGRASRSRERMYGTQLVLLPNIFNASTETVLRAVEQLGNLPVVRD
ncbi:hypothetical protein ACX80U_09815 [Arthrobacter sp. TmT3-37]